MDMRLIFSALFLAHGLLFSLDLTASGAVLLIPWGKANEVLEQAIFPDSCKREFNQLMPLQGMITRGNVEPFLVLLKRNFPTKNPRDLIKSMIHKDSKKLLSAFPQITIASRQWKEAQKLKLGCANEEEESDQELVPQTSILNKVPESWEELFDEE
jgi:hypothetical protein